MSQKNNYECMFILMPTLSKDETDKLIERFQNVLATQNGEVVKVERLGKRKLAYEIKAQQEGFYVLFQFKAPGAAVLEYERQLRLTDSVLKYQTLIVQPLRQLKVKVKKVKPVAEAAVAAPVLA
jgi:small subunit ribosomal protein S6